MLFYAQNAQALTLGGWWWFVPPGAMIALLGCGLSLINFSIDGIINPRLRTAPKAARNLRKAEQAADERSSRDRKSTRLNSSHVASSYAGLCLKKKKSRRSRACVRASR